MTTQSATSDVSTGRGRGQGTVVPQDSLGHLCTSALHTELDPVGSLPFLPGILPGEIDVLWGGQLFLCRRGLWPDGVLGIWPGSPEGLSESHPDRSPTRGSEATELGLDLFRASKRKAQEGDLVTSKHTRLSALPCSAQVPQTGPPRNLCLLWPCPHLSLPGSASLLCPCCSTSLRSHFRGHLVFLK